ncbi:hypothetical protein BKA62DRAFT_110894 [Auriculariales sp. MPI-PUGE-AT-0066]|nr:hypothetical protein BKA62DRAFT_110894 [Auriculariales sp. MPI-PUGE-AT-0066]
MSRTARYTPLAPSRDDEMEAAFESDDEGHDDTADEAARRPMLPNSHNHSNSNSQASHVPPTVTTTGGYNFEQVYDYDYPPPGSPPGPSSTALPNSIGNSNGLLPTEPVWRPSANPTFLQRGLRRLFPARYSRLATSDGPALTVGGGSSNDGVFANVTAKPTSARVERTPDGVYVMPEESQKDTPPSYAAAQADSVPPYWETTVHAPSASIAGEMIVDNLPTGTLFSFLWNMLISLSFNFVGFLLTYLLHTTHAAKYGSRAGLGITLLQYGFALRNRDPNTTDVTGGQDQWLWDTPEPTDSMSSEGTPTSVALPATTGAADTTTPPVGDDMQVAMPYPQEWIAFFLMTVGWFLVLTSFLGYWRVKRWEYQILQAAQQNQNREVPSSEQVARDQAVRRNLEQLFGFSMRRADERAAQHEREQIQAQAERDRDLEAGHAEADEEENLTPEERRLRADLRAAGLI